MDLKNIYNRINNCLDKLYDYDDYSGHINLVNEISECIDLLGGFFGVRTLKINIGPFKKDETVWVTQDEAGTWVNAIDDNRTIDLYDYQESNIDDIEDWFYSTPEPPVDACQLLAGEKTIEEIVGETENRVNYLVNKSLKF